MPRDSARADGGLADGESAPHENATEDTRNEPDGRGDPVAARDVADADSALPGVEGAIATPEDFRHSRDENGDLVPVLERVPGETRPCAACGGTGVEGTSAVIGTGDDEDGVEVDECDRCDGSGQVPLMVRVRPITQGEAERYLPQDGQVGNLPDEQMLAILREFVVEPDFSDVDSLDEFYAFGLDPLLMAVMNASGFRMTQGVIAENSDLMDVVQGNSRGGR